MDLAIHLRDTHEYATKVHALTDKEEEEFVLQGVRHRVQIDPEFIDSWVKNMVIIGSDFGCKFGGWGVKH